MSGKGRQTVRKPATKLPHLRKKMRNITPRDRSRGKGFLHGGSKYG